MTTPTVEEIVRTLAMAITHSEQGHYDKNEALVRDTISPLVSNTETTNTMTQDTPTVEEKSHSEEWGAWRFVSEMLSTPNPDPELARAGIYNTSKCYEQIHDFVVEQKRKAFEEGVKAERERIWEEFYKLAEPDERQFGAGELHIHLYEVHKIINQNVDQYKCPSHYDDNDVLRDCTCGKCK